MSEREYYTRDLMGRPATFYLDGNSAVHIGHRTTPAPIHEARPATNEEIADFESEEHRREKAEQERKEQERREAMRLMAIYGFDPREVGNRPRGFWEENGELVIEARDGGGNEPDCYAGKFGNFLGTEEDGFDCTYRYYRYAPVARGETP